MKENFKEVKQQIEAMITGHFIPVLKDQISGQRKFMLRLSPHLFNLERIRKTVNADSFNLNEIISINEQIAKLLNEHFVKKEKKSFIESFTDYNSVIENFLDGTENIVTEIQDDLRFVSQKDDNLFIQIVKPIKRILLGISNIPTQFSNTFRKMFRKPLKPKKDWKRNIQLKKLREYHFKYLLSHELTEFQKKTFVLISNSQRSLKNIYEILDAYIETRLYEQGHSEENKDSLDFTQQIKDLHANLDEYNDKISLDIMPVLEKVMNEYEISYSKGGTIEYPKYKLGKRAIKKVQKHQNKKFMTVQSGWQNNLLALTDSFKMNNEIYLIKYKTKLELNNLLEDFKRKINDRIIPNSKKIYEFVNKTKDTILISNSQNELIRRYDSLRNEITYNLTDELIPKINNLVIEENISSLAVDFSKRFTSHLNSISNERILVRTDEYDGEIKDSELSYISPKEILEYSAAPKIFSSATRLKSSLNSEIQQIQNVFGEIDHISDFSIDSALNLLKTEKPNLEESKTTAIEGLERALNKITEVENKFGYLTETFGKELGSATSNFHSELKELTHTEKLFDVKLKLAKAKTLEKSKQFKREAKTKLKNFFPHFLWLIRKYFRKLKGYYHQGRELIGLAPKAKIISSEVSDYLAETHAAIHALPFVYQRLFEIKPLEDRRFYFGRDLEMKEINKAYNNWQAGKYSPTIIVGEKGSGITTLINFFNDSLNDGFKVIRASIDRPCYETKDFLAILGNMFEEKIFNDCEDVISYLNGLNYKQVVILENLQRLFLRKVHGFNSLKNLFEIISRTNKNVFWLTTSTLYCWNYLDKSVHAPDHMGYVVNLRKLNENQITELVSKRHRVSGYNIEYEADSETLKSKSYKNLSEPEKQPYLMRKFFGSLNKFAQSNISLALLFWLRSAKEIVGDKIIIGSPPELDYSFLENLSTDKIFALNALLIHDGLGEEDYSLIFNVPIKQSRQLLLLLYDDGIVVKQNEMYVINPLLYRQIVALLNAKNIIN